MLLRVASLPLIGLRHLDNVTRCPLPDLTSGSKGDLSALWDTPSDTLAAGLSHLLSLSLRIRMPLGSRNHLYVSFSYFQTGWVDYCISSLSLFARLFGKPWMNDVAFMFRTNTHGAGWVDGSLDRRRWLFF
ncbi:hypothetical protein VFPPC_17714 [Pochonia chlamydosporia 170]|uniref:Uncharacterized protein n=1 Tax=Pochonia chlamydosporia 170 TaxID=1380566 RepID=A0A219AQR3_METCM|nr:hypothetical protein VFPPC_17714 [Pochonia chlamydosporia 170]OWT43110.1 hypothetical protein VFPPC_17714 [Pochonia chlamydosporia 170]